jgi:N-acylneuraminate cytidylyltransferase
MTRRIAIIPAREGSKRIQNKNTRDFCGKPIIAYAIQAAHASGLFDVVHVSTESAYIQETVRKLGLHIDFMRPSELADDHTPIMPVLKYVLDTYESRGQMFDQVWLLMACAPLIDALHLQQAAALFDRFGGSSALTAVSEFAVPIEWALTLSHDGKLTPVQAGMFAVRSQDLEKKYFDAGAFTAFPATIVRASEGAGSDAGFVGYVLPRGSAIDIDDEADWALAEAMYRNKVGVGR